MKKIVLSMALCVVLFGAVTTVTGCGKKPRNDALLQVKGTVWEETADPLPPPQTIFLLSFEWASLYSRGKNGWG